MSYPSTTRPLIASWSPNPIPNLSLSAGGLLALADLNTVAQRTVIAGGSSWLDALVLAPGLHYQQAADALDGKLAAAEESAAGGGPVRYVVSNAALVGFLARLRNEARETGTVTLDVSALRDGLARREMDSLAQKLAGLVRPSPAATPLALEPVEMDWLSHVFYLLSPLLTTSAVTLMVLLADWWGLAFILALMLSRILNIWSIKQRSRPDDEHQPKGRPAGAPSEDRLTEYAIDLGHGRRAVLRGLSSDLQAVTTQTWLRAKTDLDGYLEAAAKLLVYLVAAFSGNLSQAGAVVLMALLLVSAGLLGLSNSHARGLQLNGRVARLQLHAAALKDRQARRPPPHAESGRVQNLL
ncbi:hypothetical protein CDD83_3024 [Cordyceps sp. RAO-2017]|nr:hypothetical protein CDD83_3024 [Cordyceps sp. RAO-2017]